MPSPLETLRRRRRARVMMRRLRELDRLDAAYGVGRDPYAPVPAAGTPPPRARRATLVVVALLTLCLVGTTGALWSRPVPAADPAGYAFLNTLGRDGTPMRWDSCAPVRFVVNPEDAPPGWPALVATGIEHVSEATGLDFEDAGTTDERDFDDRRPGSPVLIGWADEDEVPGLEGDVAGLAGPSGSRYGPGVGSYSTGMVVLDTEVFDRLLPHRPVDAQAILDHELGHLVGLDHVDDPNQLMYDRTSLATEYAAGDLSGLRELGRGRCNP